MITIYTVPIRLIHAHDLQLLLQLLNLIGGGACPDHQHQHRSTARVRDG